MIGLVVFVVTVLAIWVLVPFCAFHREIGGWYDGKRALRMKAKKHFCVDCVHCYKGPNKYRDEYFCDLELANYNKITGELGDVRCAEYTYGGKYCKWESAADMQDVVEGESE